MNRLPPEREGGEEGIDREQATRRKEEQIDAHVRSLLVWRQEDELMLAGKEIRHQGGGFIVIEK